MFKDQKVKNRIVYFLITALFFVEALLIAPRAESLRSLQWIDLILLAFATYRLAHTVSWNKISDWFRFPLVEEVDSDTGAGKSLKFKEGGWLAPIGEALTCPICTGTHAAVFLLLTYLYFNGFGLALMYGLGVAGAFEFVHWIGTSAEWKANESRQNTGKIWLGLNKGFSEGYFVKGLKEATEKRIARVLEQEAQRDKHEAERAEMERFSNDLISMLTGRGNGFHGGDE